MEKIATLLVTGPLASGKSTLCRHLLEGLVASSAKVAFIRHKFANEFEIETEQEPDGAQFRGEVFDFGSGCICCSPKGDMSRLLWALASENAACLDTGVPVFTHLLVQTTGLAEPAVFARLFTDGDDARIGDAFELVGVVCTVDPARLGEQVADTPPAGLSNKACEQLNCATAIVLNARPGADVTMLDGAVATALTALSRAPRLLPCVSGVTPGDLFGALPWSDVPSSRAADGIVSFALAGHDKRTTTHCLVAHGQMFSGPVAALLASLESLCLAGGLLRVKANLRVLGEGWIIAECAAGEAIRTRHQARWPGGASHTAPPASGRCGDETCDVIHSDGTINAADDDATSRIFLVGRAVPVAALVAQLRACGCPPGFAYAGDVSIDFGFRHLARARISAVDPQAAENGSARVAAVAGSDFPPPKIIDVPLGPGVSIALAHHGGRVYASAAACPHAGGRLSDSTDIEDFGGVLGVTITCPVHFFVFSMASGRCITARSCADLPRHKVRIAADGAIYVALTPLPPAPPGTGPSA